MIIYMYQLNIYISSYNIIHYIYIIYSEGVYNKNTVVKNLLQHLPSIINGPGFLLESEDKVFTIAI